MNIVGQELRFRPSGSDSSAWVIMRFRANQDIEISDITRGVAYDIELRNYDETGRMSDPVSITHTVGTTAREGALALPVNSVANMSSTWNTGANVTYVAYDAYATISVSAGSLVIGGTLINYGASSATVYALPLETRTYYLYYDDPNLQGGTLPLMVTEDFIDSLSGDYKVAITAVKIKFPDVGGGPVNGGGSIAGGGGSGGTKFPPTDPWTGVL